MKVGSLDVDVSYRNLSEGRTNAKGELLVPDLMPIMKTSSPLRIQMWQLTII